MTPVPQVDEGSGIELHRSLASKPEDPSLKALVAAVADAAGVPFRPLLLQALLYLPRISDVNGLLSRRSARTEIERLTQFVPKKWEWGPDFQQGEGLLDASIRELDEGRASEILERFHYLRSTHQGSRHYGMWMEGAFDRPVAIASVSLNDVPTLQDLAQRMTVSVERTKVVSRVFAFPQSPRNSISRLLSSIARSERSLGNVRLFTYVNPNLGFTGVSYRASSWEMVGDEPGTTYRYVDQNYMTDRYLRRTFGTSRDEELRHLLGDRFERSIMNLEPLLVYSR